MRPEIKSQVKAELQAATLHSRTASKLVLCEVKTTSKRLALVVEDRTIHTGRIASRKLAEEDGVSVLDSINWPIELAHSVSEIVWHFDFGAVTIVIAAACSIIIFYLPVWLTIFGKEVEL